MQTFAQEIVQSSRLCGRGDVIFGSFASMLPTPHKGQGNNFAAPKYGQNMEEITPFTYEKMWRKFRRNKIFSQHFLAKVPGGKYVIYAGLKT